MINLFSKCTANLLIIAGLLTSCHSVVKTTAIETDSEVSRIIFVSLKISRGKSGEDSIELVSKTWASGNAPKANENMEPRGELLICEFLDRNSKVLSSVRLPNPLTAFREEYSPDGSIKRVEPKLEMSYFSIRSTVSSKAVLLQISNDKGKVIGTFDLL